MTKDVTVDSTDLVLKASSELRTNGQRLSFFYDYDGSGGLWLVVFAKNYGRHCCKCNKRWRCLVSGILIFLSANSKRYPWICMRGILNEGYC